MVDIYFQTDTSCDSYARVRVTYGRLGGRRSAHVSLQSHFMLCTTPEKCWEISCWFDKLIGLQCQVSFIFFFSFFFFLLQFDPEFTESKTEHQQYVITINHKPCQSLTAWDRQSSRKHGIQKKKKKGKVVEFRKGTFTGVVCDTRRKNTTAVALGNCLRGPLSALFSLKSIYSLNKRHKHAFN